MRKMRKPLAITAAVALPFGLAACAEDEGEVPFDDPGGVDDGGFDDGGLDDGFDDGFDDDGFDDGFDDDGFDDGTDG